jgi:hypothetical protein
VIRIDFTDSQGGAHLSLAPNLHCVEIVLRSGNDPTWVAKLLKHSMKESRRRKTSLASFTEHNFSQKSGLINREGFALSRNGTYEAIWYSQGQLGNASSMIFKLTQMKAKWQSFLLEIEATNQPLLFHFHELKEASGSESVMLRPGLTASWQFSNLDQLIPPTRFDRLDTFEVG